MSDRIETARGGASKSNLRRVGSGIGSAGWLAPRTSSRERVVAAVGAAAVVGGGVAASIAQRTAPTADFVSILGVKGRRGAWAYRIGQGVAAGACLRLGGSAVAAARYRCEDWPDNGRCRADVVLRREPRGAAMFASGCLLAAIAAVPCSPTSPIPLVEGTDMALRDWFHVPAAVALFYLWPVAAHGWVRALLLVNLAPLIPLIMTDPHGPATAVLQRTMVVLAAVALLAWQPAFSRFNSSRSGPPGRVPVSRHALADDGTSPTSSFK